MASEYSSSPWISFRVLGHDANDIDGTVVEENYREAGATTVQHLRRQELPRLIREAGCEPVERDTAYKPVARTESTFTVLGLRSVGAGAERRQQTAEKAHLWGRIDLFRCKRRAGDALLQKRFGKVLGAFASHGGQPALARLVHACDPPDVQNQLASPQNGPRCAPAAIQFRHLALGKLSDQLQAADIDAIVYVVLE